MHRAWVVLTFLAFPALAGEPPREGEPPASTLTIVDKPIAYGEDRIRLTVAYRQAHQDPAATDQLITPRAIVVHYTGGRSWKSTWKYFDKLHIEAGRQKQKQAGELNVSAHFIVDRDGTIYRLVPETWMARHCIGLNHVAVGIENVGDGPGALTEAQVKANAALVRDLVRRYPTIDTLLGHHEYRRMEGTPLWLERDPAYRNQKPDPGAAFMKKLRAAVADLGLAAPPAPPKPTRKTTQNPSRSTRKGHTP